MCIEQVSYSQLLLTTSSALPACLLKWTNVYDIPLNSHTLWLLCAASFSGFLVVATEAKASAAMQVRSTLHNGTSHCTRSKYCTTLYNR